MREENEQQGEALARWRLILGRFADDGIGQPLRGDAARMDAALEYLDGREYHGRGARPDKQQGGLGPSQLNVPHWLNEVRDLFPRETVEIVSGTRWNATT